jgi:translation elongation factor IF5A
MVLELINGTAAKSGKVILVDNEAYTVRSNDISKSGKHGSSKCRIEAISIFTGKKKVIACPGSTRFEVPLIQKLKAQVLSLEGERVSVMDLESYETLEMPYLEEIKSELVAEKQVEYWDVEGKTVVMKII